MDATGDDLARDLIGRALWVGRVTARRAGRRWLADEAECVALDALAAAVAAYDPGRVRDATRWISCVVRRRVLNWLRHEGYEGRAKERAVPPFVPADPVARDGYDHLTHGLPPLASRLFRLVFVEGHDVKAAALAVGLSESDGRRHYHRGLEHARKRA